MFTKRTAIGIGVGSVIIVIGLASLFTNIGIETREVDETFGVGEFTSYRLTAPNHTPQIMNITGDAFDVKLESPADGLQIPLTSHKKQVTFDWIHLADGDTRIEIQNTGNSDLHVEATFQVTTDPIFLTKDIMVIITGVVIIGFSLRFSIQKPRGF